MMMRSQSDRKSAIWKQRLIIGILLTLQVVAFIRNSLRVDPNAPAPVALSESAGMVDRITSGTAIDRFRQSMIILEQATTAGPSSLICGKLPVEKVEKCRHNYQYVVVGVTKSGTATLKEIAMAHPKVRTHFTKESHFFDILGVNEQKSKSGLSWSLKDNFHNTVGIQMDQNDNIYKKHDDPKDDFVYGEHSPGLFWQVDYKCVGGESKTTLRCKDQGYRPNATIIIDRMAQVLPKETLMVVALRNPTDRAFSHFAHFGPECPEEWYGRSDPSKCFHEYVVKEIQSIEACFSAVGRLDIRCIHLPFDHLSRGKRLVGVGLYSIFLQHWLPRFPNFCLIDVVSHGKDQQGIAQHLEECLGIAHEKNLNLAYSKISYSSNMLPMWDITREILDRFYAPYTRLLCQMAPHTCDWPWVERATEQH